MKKRKAKPDSAATPLLNGEDRFRVYQAAIDVLIYRDDTGADLEDATCDLLADLMHWCNRHGQDFDHEVRRAREHYEAEKEG